MGNRLELGGFRELRDQFATLPRDLSRDADPLVARHAEHAQAAVRGAYPRVTGALIAGVKVVHETGAALVARYRLITSAPHAHLYEFGTSTQRPRATFYPIAEPAQRAAVADVAVMVEREGFTVTGDCD